MMLDKRGVYETKRRRLIVHVDDLGMFGSTVTAYKKMVSSGKCYSVSIMPSAPYFDQALALLHESCQHKALDVGVHLTLNSEWRDLRWGPVCETEKVHTLVDSHGFFHEKNSDSFRLSSKREVQKEMGAQIAKVVKVGVNVTHIDSHMLALLNKRFAKSYAQLAYQYKIGIMLPGTVYNNSKLRPDLNSAAKWLERRGWRLIDNFDYLSYEDASNRLEQLRRCLAGLPEGVTHIGFHPAEMSDELRNTARDWRIRVADFELLMSDKLDDILRAEDIELTNYGELLRENKPLSLGNKGFIQKIQTRILGW